MAPAADDIPREDPAQDPRPEPTTSTGPVPTSAGSVPTITGSIPTITGAIPVLEDPADHELAHLPDEEQLSRTRAKVTVMVIVVLTTLSAIGPLATDMYIPAFPEVIDSLGTTAARVQLTITAFFVGTASGQIVAGPASDRLGRRVPPGERADVVRQSPIMGQYDETLDRDSAFEMLARRATARPLRALVAPLLGTALPPLLALSATVRLSSPDRVMFPATGATKLDLARYYLAVGDGIVAAAAPCSPSRSRC